MNDEELAKKALTRFALFHIGKWVLIIGGSYIAKRVLEKQLKDN